MFDETGIKAIGFGLLCASTLPLGALVTRWWTPRNRMIAALMAFGAGALLSALSIDLIGKSVEKGHFVPLTIGCVVGGGLFVLCNQLLNLKGGFLRKMATTANYLKLHRERELREVLQRMSQLPFFTLLPAEQVRSIVHSFSKRQYKSGEHLFNKGDEPDGLYVIDSGDVKIFMDGTSTRPIHVGINGVVGEMAIITGEKRSGTVIAENDVTTWYISKEKFSHFLESSPELAAAAHKLVRERLDDLRIKQSLHSTEARRWAKRAARRLDREMPHLTSKDIQAAAKEHSGAPLAIFMGNLLDAIPESLVIGASMSQAHVSLALVAGIFLSNFPESLSASAGMRENGMSFKRVLTMWSVLMLAVGAGAWLGCVAFVEAPAWGTPLMEGIAAGAMLTMVSETMLPEAFHKGGSITGMMTLAGFLAAVFFKTLE